MTAAHCGPRQLRIYWWPIPEGVRGAYGGRAVYGGCTV